MKLWLKYSTTTTTRNLESYWETKSKKLKNEDKNKDKNKGKNRDKNKDKLVSLINEKNLNLNYNLLFIYKKLLNNR